MDLAEQKVLEFRATILRAYLMIAIVAGSGMVAIYLSIGVPALASWVGLYALSNGLVYLALTRRRLSRALAGQCLQALFLLVCVVSLDQIGTMVAPWILVAPIAAFPVVGPRHGVLWSLAAPIAPLWLLVQQPAAEGLVTVLLWLTAYATTATAMFLFSRHNEANIRTIARLSHTDSLTGTFNRQMFDELAVNLVNRARRAKEPLALMMIDIDHFKRFNDHYGHVEGDRALSAVAGALRNTARRATDLVFRYGGEEFCVVSTMLEKDSAVRLAHAIADAVRSLEISHAQAERGRLTVSIGVVFADDIEEETVEYLVRHADRALYSAKRGGRDRVETHLPAAQLALPLDGAPAKT